MPEESIKTENEDKDFSPQLIEKSFSLGNFLTPEGIIMMSLAVLIDFAGLVILFFGLDDGGIIDIIGLFFIGGWMLFRSGTVSVTKKSKKIISRFLKRLGFSFFVELIPYLGNIAPSWILAVYFELKNQ